MGFVRDKINGALVLGGAGYYQSLYCGRGQWRAFDALLICGRNSNCISGGGKALALAVSTYLSAGAVLGDGGLAVCPLRELYRNFIFRADLDTMVPPAGHDRQSICSEDCCFRSGIKSASIVLNNSRKKASAWWRS